MAAALAPAYAIAILMAGGPDDGCPSPRQLADALSAHLPGMVLPLGHATGPTTLRLAVTTDAAGAMRLDLNDPEGGPLLHRWLPASERAQRRRLPGAGRDGRADRRSLLARGRLRRPDRGAAAPQTAAAEGDAAADRRPSRSRRRRRHHPSRRPRRRPRRQASPPARHRRTTAAAAPSRCRRPRWWIGAGAGGLLTATGERAGAASLAIAVERPVFRRRLGLRLSAGPTATRRPTSAVDCATGQRDHPAVPGAHGRATCPSRWASASSSPGSASIWTSISVAFTDGTDLRDAAAAPSPGADAALGWALPLPHDVYVRVLAAGRDAGSLSRRNCL